MAPEDFRDTCNKSVPIYIPILPGRYAPLLIVLHNYIYRRWFQLYRSEIEHERFLCKFITLQGLPDEGTTPSQSAIDAIVSLNKAICAQVQALHSIYD